VIVAQSVLALVILLGGLVLSGWLWLRPPPYLWLYAFAEGVASGTPQSIEQNVIRWADMTDLIPIWDNRFDLVSEESKLQLVAYQLRVYDGRSETIPRALRNMLDPYASVGRMISSIGPSSVTQTIPRFPVIDEIIQPHLPKQPVKPLRLEAMRMQGRAVAFARGRLRCAVLELLGWTISRRNHRGSLDYPRDEQHVPLIVSPPIWCPKRRRTVLVNQMGRRCEDLLR
jgi:hypothetical protein